MSPRRPPQSPHIPDFGEVLRRAQELNPDAVSTESVAEACRITEATGPVMLTSVVDHPDPSLAPFVASAQRRIGGLIDRESRREPPPLPDTRSKVGGVAALIALCAAAIVVLGIGVTVRGPTRAEVEAHPKPAEAARAAANYTEPTQTIPRRPPPARGSGGDTVVLPPIPIPVPQLAPPVPAPDPEEAVEVEVTKPRRPDALRRLDAEAQAHWQRGDLAGARRVFEKIVRQGGRSSWAELAYGDLFTIAHQQGNRAQEAHLWRRYLKKFPRGRFADGARASLCRHAKGDEARTCWGSYLAEQPNGRHRTEASRRLAVEP